MSLQNTHATYGSVAKFFHWLIAVVLLCQIVYGFFLEDFPKDMQPITYNIHKLIGLTILFLMSLRLLWSAYNPKPLLPADTLPWQRLAERIVHFLLYFVVFAMPIIGLIGSVAAGRAPHIGNFNFVLPFVPRDKSLVDASFAIHNLLAFALIALLCIHIGAALHHHFIKKDNILRRMLPG